MELLTYPQALLGFRSWVVDTDNLLLAPISARANDHFYWQPGVTVGICGEHIAHPIPSRYCTCGLYAWHEYYNEDLHLTANSIISGAVIGKGSVQVHADGFRCSEAQIIALLKNTDTLNGDIQEMLSDRYGVPLFEDKGEMIGWATSVAEPAPILLRPDNTTAADPEQACCRLVAASDQTAQTIQMLLSEAGIGIEAIRHFQLGVSSHSIPYSRCPDLLVAPYDLDQEMATICSTLFSGTHCKRCGFLFTSSEMSEHWRQHYLAQDDTDDMLSEWVWCPSCYADADTADFSWADSSLVPEVVNWHIDRSSIPDAPLYNLKPALDALNDSPELFITDSYITTWRMWQQGYKAIMTYNRCRENSIQLQAAIDIAQQQNKQLTFVRPEINNRRIGSSHRVPSSVLTVLNNAERVQFKHESDFF